MHIMKNKDFLHFIHCYSVSHWRQRSCCEMKKSTFKTLHRKHASCKERCQEPEKKAQSIFSWTTNRNERYVILHNWFERCISARLCSQKTHYICSLQLFAASYTSIFYNFISNIWNSKGYSPINFRANYSCNFYIICNYHIIMWYRVIWLLFNLIFLLVRAYPPDHITLSDIVWNVSNWLIGQVYVILA